MTFFHCSYKRLTQKQTLLIQALSTSSYLSPLAFLHFRKCHANLTSGLHVIPYVSWFCSSCILEPSRLPLIFLSFRMRHAYHMTKPFQLLLLCTLQRLLLINEWTSSSILCLSLILSRPLSSLTLILIRIRNTASVLPTISYVNNTGGKN